MRVMYDFFSGREVKFALSIKPKEYKTQDRTLAQSAQDKSKNQNLLRNWTANDGTRYLIYSPTIGLRIASMKSSQGSITIPIHLVYQFGGILKRVYEKILFNDWYSQDKEDGQYYVDHEKVSSIAMRMSVYNTSIVIVPSLVERHDLGVVPGISIGTLEVTYGSMTFEEVKALIDTINHLDMATISLLAGMCEKLETIDEKVDLLLKAAGITYPPQGVL